MQQAFIQWGKNSIDQTKIGFKRRNIRMLVIGLLPHNVAKMKAAFHQIYTETKEMERWRCKVE